MAKQVAREMQKTIVMDSESTIPKVLSGLIIQGEKVDEQMDTWNWFMINVTFLLFLVANKFW